MLSHSWTLSGWMIGGMFLFWLATISLVISFVLRVANPTRARHESPFTLAERRSASGQITASEFETLRRTLTHAPAQIVLPEADSITR